MPERHFQSGDVIFRPGDPAEEAYLILSGSVEILAGSPDCPLQIALLGAEDVFGEMSLIEEQPRSLTARALAPSRTTTLSRTEFEYFLTRDPQRCRRYLQSLFERLRTTTERLQAAQPRPPSLVARQVTLYPLTPRAALSLPEQGLSLSKYPFRIGRSTDTQDPRAMDLNDLWIQDTAPFNVSRNHAAILLGDDGHLAVLDRGSHLGTIVNGQRIGGDSLGRQARLVVGPNRLILGSLSSPFQFRLTVGASS